jgi:hypothetical protein
MFSDANFASKNGVWYVLASNNEPRVYARHGIHFAT